MLWIRLRQRRFSPGEGETVLGKTFHKAPGGKGANQAVQAARLGADVTMVGKLGRDTNGEELLKACREAGIHTEHVIYDEKLASGCAVIILEEKEGESAKNRILVIPGTNMSMEKAELEFMEDLIKEYDLLMLQLEIPMEVNEYLENWPGKTEYRLCSIRLRVRRCQIGCCRVLLIFRPMSMRPEI